MTNSIHKPVLLNEIVSLIVGSKLLVAGKSIASNQLLTPNYQLPFCYLDGTLGGCGHALAMAEAFKGRLKIIGLDQDPNAIERAEVLLKGKAEEVIIECSNFRKLDEVIARHNIQGIDLVLLDLGLSSDELETSGRGFSFRRDEPLFMTMGDPAKAPFTAKDIVNGWKEEDIANVIFAYGEERFARRIARAILGYREKKLIESSGELAEIVKASVGFMYRRAKIHPATKTFQALRIAVNDELNALKEGLAKGYESLKAGGKMAVISFHSLEDRIVKNFYKEKASEKGDRASKKPIIATEEEIAENPRARSAKLRVIQKL
ncbi:MAG: 16S rRNA (cytosine(1402)-N(4))-methyltransferase RsmH [Candidatus Taylorbacteria bacterium]|nr:16S rRNA (cytosine(1402)-N(4))-methyltransferase RsmH [Candidatus Taylorbacteria bacterium]